MKNLFQSWKNFLKKLLHHKIFMISYLIVILVLLIITVKYHRKQDFEHFANPKFQNKFYQYSDCKKDCVLKYDEPDKIKVCKKHCKCKKTCSTEIGKKNQKKCNQKCKEIKMNLYRDNPEKMEKIKLKEESKIARKKEKKEEKIEQQRELIKQEKANQSRDEMPKTRHYLVNLINQNTSERDREYLFNLGSSTYRFKKDLRNIFRMK